MYSIIHTAVLNGLEAVRVSVEADVSEGMPQFEMVGFLSSEVKEARERVRTALRNSGFRLPPKRITINLTPADIRKSGNGCDLPVAASILSAFGFLDDQLFCRYLMVGEVSLDGRILPVNGALAYSLLATQCGLSGIILPKENAAEAAINPDCQVVPVSNLIDLITLAEKGDFEDSIYQGQEIDWTPTYKTDFSQIHGQKLVKRACEIAASGMHNLLIIGPPGSGKTMAASRLPTILPELSLKEKLEVTKIYSISGLLDASVSVCRERPFRAPHHTITMQAMAGGGAVPKPGEISLAHFGVLFLDELPEFQKSALEVLREPMEDKKIRISRVGVSSEYPADFLLLCAMNPCKCGYYPDMNRCTCSYQAVQKYISRISQPLLDRLDLCVESGQIRYQDLTNQDGEETSAQIRERVRRVQEIQRERFAGMDYRFNSQIPSDQVHEICRIDPAVRIHAKQVFEDQKITARAYYKLLRCARTIADMDESRDVKDEHFSEAVLFRSLDRKYWQRS